MQIFRIGDRVQTQQGPGYVQGTMSWRDVVVGLDDLGAKVFSEHCAITHGAGFRDTWQRVFVRVDNGKMAWFLNSEIVP